MSRPWCLLELHAAVTRDVPIFIIRVANSFAGDPATDMKTILEDLPGYLAAKNPAAIETLKSLEYDIADIANVLQPVLAPLALAESALEEASDKAIEVVGFNPHQGTAMLQAEISAMAHALVKIACPQNEALMIDFDRKGSEPWPIKRHIAVCVCFIS